ncbi:transglycosylase SLT domain-containing protein [Agaribacter flavus]|uniref:Transglycosylase SLT domain-containing protein n=1 Tax=Agaribacter flavus TaxID=1902781 RepID=A0ABV7FJ80_9ALTE
MQKKFKKYFSVAFIFVFALSACSVTPPEQRENICKIFEEKRDWYDAAEDMRDKYGVPIHVPMAMMYQESSFRHNAKPPRDYIFFGLIPWGRVSSAYGYAQAKTMTWQDYKKETGNRFAARDDFDDAIDFMGWFISKTHKINRISKWDAGAQYLNYHEGWGGYKRKSYKKKAWLQKVAVKVDKRSKRYATQLKTCEKELQKSWFWRLFS